jgi:Protein containing tetrapyrrole methyltransferase domain and MazG-like (predicted pyrophosphatase) domain
VICSSTPLERVGWGTGEAELGDLIFSIINAARLYGINPDNALERTNHKFIRRFRYVS